MRFVRKGPEPESLREFKAMANPPDWLPTYDGLPQKRKSVIKMALIEEQGGLCCYCECILRERDSHIEHLKPQHPYEELALDYGNMLCSCLSDVEKGDPLHCGMAKGDWYDERLLISPLDPDCGTHFKFLGDGSIVPVDASDDAAVATIAHLRLDDKELTAKRKAVIDSFLDDCLTDDDRERFLNDYLTERASSPSEFISAVRSVLLPTSNSKLGIDENEKDC